jgi:nucleoside-diphosphate-sugar epimerase
MHVFVTGATGWVGSAVVEELRAGGHRMSGLARSDAAAAALAAANVEVLRGSLEDLESLRAENGAVERRAIDALGSALAGTGKPLVVTSGVAFIAPGRLATEDDVRDPNAAPFPRNPEAGAVAAAGRGVRVSVIRLAPSVHGYGESHGFVPRVIALAREHGKSAFIGDGSNRWPGVHRLDVARLYRLALERAADYAVYHAIADEGVPFKEIAEVVGRRLDLPVVGVSGDEVGAHFGAFAHFAQIDAAASSAQTREALSWHPREPGLLQDVDSAAYFPVVNA